MYAGLDYPPVAADPVAAAREEERRQLARELHDGPAQVMAAALFGADLALAAFTRTPGEAQEELQRTRDLVRDALAELRALMSGLRPPLLEERGLQEALRSLSGPPGLWGPAVSVDVRGLDHGQHLAPESELVLFRIAQEAVSNARRHSGASQVDVALDVCRDLAHLTVADDGSGFTPSMPPPGQGVGLPGMRERVQQLGGQLTVESGQHRGTRIVASLPLRADRVRNEEERP